MKRTWYAFTSVYGVIATELPDNEVQVMGIIHKQLMAQRREPGGEKTFKKSLDTWAQLWILDTDKLDPKQARKHFRRGERFRCHLDALKMLVDIRKHPKSGKLFAQRMRKSVK